MLEWPFDILDGDTPSSEVRHLVEQMPSTWQQLGPLLCLQTLILFLLQWPGTLQVESRTLLCYPFPALFPGLAMRPYPMWAMEKSMFEVPLLQTKVHPPLLTRTP